MAAKRTAFVFGFWIFFYDKEYFLNLLFTVSVHLVSFTIGWCIGGALFSRPKVIHGVKLRSYVAFGTAMV
jgi:hypothetical protein